MSVSSQVTRIRSARDDIAAAIEGKGVEVPAGTKIDGLAALVSQIPVMTEQQAFLAAHPVGSYMETSSGTSPSSSGGTWEQVRSAGRGALWRRTK